MTYTLQFRELDKCISFNLCLELTELKKKKYCLGKDFVAVHLILNYILLHWPVHQMKTVHVFFLVHCQLLISGTNMLWCNFDILFYYMCSIFRQFVCFRFCSLCRSRGCRSHAFRKKKRNGKLSSSIFFSCWYNLVTQSNMTSLKTSIKQYSR